MYASSGAFFNNLEAFLKVASMQKVSAETLEGVENHLYEVEKCREHVHFEAPKSYTKSMDFRVFINVRIQL